MARMNFIDQLKLVLNEVGVRDDVQRKIFGGLTVMSMTKKKDVHANTGEDWEQLLRAVKHARSTHITNRKRWTPSQRPLFEEYEHLLDTIITRIQKAQLSGMSVAEYAAKVSADGKTAAGERNADWGTWVPESVRDDFTKRVNLHYDRIGRSRGSRLRPFLSKETLQHKEEMAKRMRTTIRTIRRLCSTVGCENGVDSTSDTPRGALYLCAARMAEIEMFKRLKDNKADIPVNWRTLLTPAMRARLRDADDSPTTVDTSDLHHFYVVHPNKDEQAQAAMEQAISDAEWRASGDDAEGDEE